MSTMISRHPDAATVMSFAAGSLAEPLAAAVAAHVAMCAACRNDLHDMELLGAAVLDKSRAANEEDAAIDLPERPQDLAALDIGLPARTVASDKLPAPIARKYSLSFDEIPWKRLAPGVWHHRLALSPGVQGDLRLLKIAAGRKMPVHGHGGEELTLVLDGAYADETGEYRRGDVQDIDDETEHRPIADKELGCICLIASERPARFKGIVERLLQPWTGM